MLLSPLSCSCLLDTFSIFSLVLAWVFLLLFQWCLLFSLSLSHSLFFNFFLSLFYFLSLFVSFSLSVHFSLSLLLSPFLFLILSHFVSFTLSKLIMKDVCKQSYHEWLQRYIIQNQTLYILLRREVIWTLLYQIWYFVPWTSRFLWLYT